jgi:RNA polymerase sigma factor (sigma-70 family)
MSPLLVNGRTEKELISACIVGDRQAQKSIFHMYAGKMMGVCMRYSKTRQEAEDMLQEGFIKVFTHLNDFGHEGSFEGWMRKIMINTSLKNNLKKQIQVEELNLETTREETAEPEIFSLLSEEELVKLICDLPEGYRMVFNLYAIEGYSHREIGEMLHIEESTSRSQLVKARRILIDKVNALFKIAV